MTGATRRLDVAGLGLLAAAVLWALAAGVASGANPFPLVGALLATAVGLLLGRRFALRGRPIGPAAVCVVAASVVLVVLGGVGDVAGPPFLYANANAAFYLQAAIAGLMVAFGWEGAPIRGVGTAAAILFGATAVGTGSRAAWAVLALALVVLVARPGVWVRVTVAASGAVLVAVLVVTVVVAASPGPLRGERRQGLEPLGRTRLELWREAVDIGREHPVWGIGPGRFPLASRTAGGDRDLGWAHHEFLQQAAETGIPGAALVLLLFLWGFVRLWTAPSDRLTALGAASLAVLGVHACFDYVLHFPAILVASAVMVGTAQAPRGVEAVAVGPLVRKALKAAVLPLGAVSSRRPGDVAVLLYHRLGAGKHAGKREVDISAEAFAAQVGGLAKRDLLVPIDRAFADGSGGGVVISVDDGYRDFHDHLLPIAVEDGVPVLLYLASGLVVEEGGDPVQGLTWSHLRDAVSTGLVTVGSHTHSHADLGAATEGEADGEMRRSKELIEDRLGVPCRHFAYPWGVCSPGADRAARRLFDTAALTWGVNRVGRIDRYRLARVPILRSDGPFFFQAKVQGRLDGEALLYRLAGRGPWRRR